MTSTIHAMDETLDDRLTRLAIQKAKSLEDLQRKDRRTFNILAMIAILLVVFAPILNVVFETPKISYLPVFLGLGIIATSFSLIFSHRINNRRNEIRRLNSRRKVWKD